MRILCTLLALFLFSTSIAEAGTITRPSKTFGGTSFINGVVPQASDFNGDTDTIYAEFNGSISNINVSATAAIAASKLNPDGFTANIRQASASPCLILDESDQAADTRRWYACSATSVFNLSTYTDAGVLQNDWFTIVRATGATTLGGSSGTNTINGATTFNQAVTFNGGTNAGLPTGAVSMFMGTTAPSGFLLLDGASNSCTGAAQVNASLCVQLVSLVATVNYKGSGSTATFDSATDEVISVAHGRTVNDRVHFNNSGGGLPTGLVNTLVYCIRSVTPDRYTLYSAANTCSGSVLDLTTTGTGTNTAFYSFLTPDARGRAPLGTGSGSGLTVRALGATGGEETHTLTGAESGTTSHTHGITDPTHSHSYTSSLAILTYSAGAGTEHGPLAATTGSASTGISVNNSSAASASSAHNVTDPFLVMTYIIKL